MKTLKKIEMSCGEANSLMFEYLDGELSSREALRLSAHISECPDCRAELESCRKLLDEIGKVEYPVPEKLHSNVMALVGSTAQDSPSRLKRVFGRSIGMGKRGIAAFGTFAAACAVVALVILNRGYISGGASDLASPETVQDAMVEAAGENTFSPETVGALTFSSPITMTEEAATGSAPTASNKNENNVNYKYAAADTTAMTEVTAAPDNSAELKKALAVRLQGESDRLMEAVNSWLDAGTAVLVFSSNKQPIIDGGEIIRIDGFNTVSFREILGSDAGEKLEQLIKLREENGESYQSFVPDGEFDALVVAYCPEEAVILEETSK